MNKVNVIVVGYGHLGRWHAQKAANLENANLVGIVEAFEPNQKLAQDNHPDIQIYSTIEETLDLADAYVLVTPTSTHYELTKKLLENKKHIFCEKPLCETYDQVLALEKSLQQDRVLQVGHSERCHESWEILKDDIEKMIKPISVKIERVASFKGRATDVDVVQDLMIHDLDLALFLFKKEVKSIKAWGHKIRTPKYDQVTALLSMSDGSEILITSGRNHVHEVRSLEITHDEGCLYVDLFRNKIHKANNAQFANGEFVEIRDYEKRDHLLIEQKAFYNSILNNTPAMVNYTDGKKAIELIEIVLKALNSGETIEL